MNPTGNMVRPPPPTNNLVSPLLTDLYQFTMVYAHWKHNRHNDEAVFELFFRTNPFKGGYAVFAGLEECLKYLSHFKFSASDLTYLKRLPVLSHCDAEFFDDYLANLDCSNIQVFAMKEGTIAFPKVPLLTVKGPLGIGQLVETTLLNLVNFSTLIATNACRMVVAARGGGGSIGKPTTFGSDSDENHSEIKKLPVLAEFGLRRAQGPDGGFTASKYSILGGFDATSNVQAGKLLNIPVVGTNAHAYIQAHESLDEVKDIILLSKDGKRKVHLLSEVLKYRQNLTQENSALWSSTNDGELSAFLAYGAAFPDSFLCIVDTYDTVQSGVRNFILVSLVLADLGYTSKGIRLDSGDLASLSIEASNLFHEIASQFNRPFLKNMDIVVSNDLNESLLNQLNQRQHAITIYGIGTNLVTCQEQPSLGGVYKLVELKGSPRIKLSNEIEKVLIPGRKYPYRLIGEKGSPLVDLLIGKEELSTIPEVGKQILCRHPFKSQVRVYVVPSEVKPLHELVFDKDNGVIVPRMDLFDTRNYVMNQIHLLESDILHRFDSKEYKVYVSDAIHMNLHKMWQLKAPIEELR